MISTRTDSFIAARLDDGEELFAYMLAALGETRTAVIVSAIGMLRDLEIGWLGPDGYEKRRFTDPFEILSISGTVNRKPDGKAFIHPHASLSGRDMAVIGGHLFGGTVNNTCELVFLIPGGMNFERKVLVEGEPPRFCPEKE